MPHKDLSSVHESVSCSLFYKDTSQTRWEPTLLGCAQLCPTPWDHLFPTRFLCPWDFFRQEHWSGMPFSTPDDLSPGIKAGALASPALAVLLLCHLGSQNALWWSHFNVITPLKYSHLVWCCGIKTLTKNWGRNTIHPITAHTNIFSSFKSWDGSKNWSHLTSHHS